MYSGDADLSFLINPKSVADEIAKNRELLKSKISSKIYHAISSMEPSKCLSFRLMKNDTMVREVSLKASVEYVEVLIGYMKSNKYNGYEVESCITPVALKATETAIIDFYTSDIVREAISVQIVEQLKNSKIIKVAMNNEINANKQWLKHEINTLLAGESASSIAGNVIEKMSDNIMSFLSSTAGHNLLALIGKLMATTTGKIMLKELGVIISKAIATEAFKSVLLVAIKKVGVGILVKTAVGKAIVALLALVGISGIPIAWIILPIIAGILIYEYNNFPENLAEKIPSSIAESIGKDFGKMNDMVAKDIVKVVMDNFVGYATKLR